MPDTNFTKNDDLPSFQIRKVDVVDAEITHELTDCLTHFVMFDEALKERTDKPYFSSLFSLFLPSFLPSYLFLFLHSFVRSFVPSFVPSFVAQIPPYCSYPATQRRSCEAAMIPQRSPETTRLRSSSLLLSLLLFLLSL